MPLMTPLPSMVMRPFGSAPSLAFGPGVNGGCVVWPVAAEVTIGEAMRRVRLPAPADSARSESLALCAVDGAVTKAARNRLTAAPLPVAISLMPRLDPAPLNHSMSNRQKLGAGPLSAEMRKVEETDNRSFGMTGKRGLLPKNTFWSTADAVASTATKIRPSSVAPKTEDTDAKVLCRTPQPRPPSNRENGTRLELPALTSRSTRTSVILSVMPPSVAVTVTCRLVPKSATESVRVLPEPPSVTEGEVDHVAVPLRLFSSASSVIVCELGAAAPSVKVNACASTVSCSLGPVTPCFDRASV